MEGTIVSISPASAADSGARVRRRRWSRKRLVIAAVAFIGLAAIAALATFLVLTIGQRDSARRDLATTSAQLATSKSQLAATKSSLAATQSQLATANQELSTRKSADAYVSFFLTDLGLLQSDLAGMETDCGGSGNSCLGDLTQTSLDLQKFQTDRAATTVPAVFANANAQLQTALDDYINGFKQLSAAVDSGSVSQVDAAIKVIRSGDQAFAGVTAAIAADLHS